MSEESILKVLTLFVLITLHKQITATTKYNVHIGIHIFIYILSVVHKQM